MKIVTQTFVLIMTLVALVGCSSAPLAMKIVKPADVDPNTRVAPYKIGVGDQVTVNVWDSAQLSGSSAVRTDGKISVPLIGDVQASGLTPIELARNLEDQLDGYIKVPQVTIILTGMQSNIYISKVKVTGAISRQSSLDYYQEMTVLDAILAAGGLTEFSAGNRALLHRKDENGKKKMYVLKIDSILKKGQMLTNYKLLPGDTITIPERIF